METPSSWQTKESTDDTIAFERRIGELGTMKAFHFIALMAKRIISVGLLSFSRFNVERERTCVLSCNGGVTGW